MKKLVLTTATVLFFATGAFAQDGGKCCKKDAKCEMTACSKDGKCTEKDKEKCAKACAEASHCKKESKDCCKKAENKAGEAK